MQYLTEEEIKAELNDYIYNVNIKYATLLNGSWGSGKTYFVKKYISELEKEYEINKNNEHTKTKKPIYISLYGLSNVSEIKSKIALSLIKNEKVKQFIPFLDVGLEIGSDFLSNKTFIQNSGGKLSKILGALYKIDNLIIFFDDLERCSIHINSILGYINELVEHNNIKVIVVADETKIGKINYTSNLELKYMIALSDKIKIEEKKEKYSWDKSNENRDNKSYFTKDEIESRTKHIFNEDNIYNEIKEKLIGKVIYYRANLNNIYDKFVSAIVINSEAKNAIIRNKEIFLRQLEENNCYNLRTIQFIFQAFNRLVEETIDIIVIEQIKDIYLNDLFSYCTIKSLKIKNGENSYNWENNQEFGTIYLGNELIDYVYKNFVTGFKFVDDYLLHSSINKERIKTTLNKYKITIVNEMNNPNDPLYKLKKWWIIPERELKLIIDELIQKIKNNEYQLELYSKIVNYLSHIEEMDICKTKIKTAIKELENNIKSRKVIGDFCEERLFDGTPQTVELYKKNIAKIRILVDNKEKDKVMNDLSDIYNNDNWGYKLKEYCNKNDGRFLSEKSFAHILNIDVIIENIENKNIEQVYEFWYALQRVYHFSNIKEFYENDKETLNYLKTQLSSIKSQDKVKMFVINKIIVFLEDVISNL